MHLENSVKLDFKDVLIRPKRSTLTSRSEVDITREFKFLHSSEPYHGIPIIAANMFSKQPRKMGKRRISETLPRCGVFLCLQTGPCPNAQTEGVSHAS